MTRVTIRREPATPLSLLDVTGDDTGTLADTATVGDGSLAFESDWTTITGNSATAIGDGGKWNYTLTSPTAGTVIAPGGVSWTGAGNVMEFSMNTTDDCVIQNETDIPESTDNWIRFYFMIDAEPNHTGQHPHGYQMRAGTIGLVLWRFERVAATTYRIGIEATKTSTDRFFAEQLCTYGVWYCWEWYMQYLTGTTFRVWPRLRAMDGTLLCAATGDGSSPTIGNFLNYTSVELGAWYGAGNYGTVPATILIGGTTYPGTDGYRRLGLSHPGNYGAPAVDARYYVADIGVSLTDWVGA